MPKKTKTAGLREPLYATIPIEKLHESPHNPRKHYDGNKLAELRDSIQEHGVLTPLLVRPDPRGYEILAGHRRFRAAAIGGITEVPAIVREMTDQQALEVLTIENLQREDVHPIEEAEGYRTLLAAGSYDAAGIAAKVGKSESYIYARLRLLELSEPVREAFLKNEITIAHARLIAPLAADRQSDALAACFEEGWGKNAGKQILLHVDDLRAWISHDGSRDLANAPFQIEDAELVAEAGPCTRCPRSSCAGLFASDEDAVCFDPGCYDRKVEVFIESQKTAGLVAISTDWNTEKVPDGVLDKDSYELIRYTNEPNEPDDDEPESKPCEFAERAILAHGYQHSVGKEALICRNPQCPEHGDGLAASQRVSARSEEGKKQREEEKQRRDAEEAKRKLQTAVRKRALEMLLDEDWSRALDRDFAAAMIAKELNGYNGVDVLRPIAKRFGIETSESGYEAQQDLAAKLRSAAASSKGRLSNGQMGELLLWLTFHEDVEHWNQHGADVLKDFAETCGISFDAIAKELKAAEAAKAAKAAEAAKSDKSGKKSKKAGA